MTDMTQNNKNESFTSYYDVNDTIVRVSSDGDEVWGEVLTTGAAYPPLKALAEGHEIDTQTAASRSGVDIS
ncbi:hypothetical protein IPP75_03370 [Candidatus Saccharibacteria bacterium]|nr:MAG: hypothetical protein IPP75_03370 [Candidatus Saccharibacteria bacterium]